MLCRTVFEALYTRFPTLPQKLVMDNGCNVHQYVLNREPAYFQGMQFYVDQMHFRGHKHCCPAYNTGARRSPCTDAHYQQPAWLTALIEAGCYRDIGNSSLAEQKNSVLRRLESQVSFMKQTTFVYFMRFFLYRLNKLQTLRNQGQCFYTF